VACCVPRATTAAALFIGGGFVFSAITETIPLFWLEGA
jgi:hypothetical protein